MDHSLKKLLKAYMVGGFIGVYVRVFIKGITNLFFGSQKMKSGWNKTIAYEICQSVLHKNFRSQLVRDNFMATKTSSDENIQKEDIYPLT